MQPSEGEAGPVRRSAKREGGFDRDEWDVALADGALYRLFQDRVTERWFVDGIVD